MRLTFLPFFCHLRLYGATNFFVHIVYFFFFSSSRFAIYPTARDQGSSYLCSCHVMSYCLFFTFLFSFFGIGVWPGDARYTDWHWIPFLDAQGHGVEGTRIGFADTRCIVHRNRNIYKPSLQGWIWIYPAMTKHKICQTLKWRAWASQKVMCHRFQICLLAFYTVYSLNIIVFLFGCLRLDYICIDSTSMYYKSQRCISEMSKCPTR